MRQALCKTHQSQKFLSIFPLGAAFWGQSTYTFVSSIKQSRVKPAVHVKTSLIQGNRALCCGKETVTPKKRSCYVCMQGTKVTRIWSS